jgi:hypothetical protein
MTLQEATSRVMKNIESGDENTLPQFGPIMTTILVQVIVYFIKKCGDRLLRNHTSRPNMVQMFILRRKVRQEFLKSGQTQFDYKTHGEAIVQALLKSVKESTKEELQSLITQS